MGVDVNVKVEEGNRLDNEAELATISADSVIDAEFVSVDSVNELKVAEVVEGESGERTSGEEVPGIRVAASGVVVEKNEDVSSTVVCVNMSCALAVTQKTARMKRL